ncbi:hypothetical protein THAOC_09526, partial [Thalassiosira oceanica]
MTMDGWDLDPFGDQSLGQCIPAPMAQHQQQQQQQQHVRRSGYSAYGLTTPFAARGPSGSAQARVPCVTPTSSSQRFFARSSPLSPSTASLRSRPVLESALLGNRLPVISISDDAAHPPTNDNGPSHDRCSTVPQVDELSALLASTTTAPVPSIVTVPDPVPVADLLDLGPADP